MSASAQTRPIRVLVAKPGLDGHDVGAKIVCRALMDAGMEVVYTGLRQSPEAIARTAAQEAVDVVGLSVLSGAHVPLCRKLAERLRAEHADDVLWVVGGNVPPADYEALRALGVRAVFGTGSPLAEIVEFVRAHAPRRTGDTR
jgi:methylmalonyl-CoA mutase C-terminal domain/subunit